MSDTRPTPETDAHVNDSTFVDKNQPHTDWVEAYFARKLERERDDARSERDQLSRDLSSLLSGDCLNGHDAVEGTQNGIAMREAIKEAHDEMHELMMAKWANLPGRANDMIEGVVNKLKPFLP